MLNRQQIQEIPGALRLTLEKARAEYGPAIRQIRRGDGPVYVCGTGGCAGLGVAAEYGFETFPAWPVVARPAEFLQTSAPRLMAPRSVLLIISAGAGEWPDAEELAHTVRRSNCQVLVLANHPESALVRSADHPFLVRAEGEAAAPAVMLCLHAALNFLALEASRIFKGSGAQWQSAADQFEQLPGKLEWLLTQFPALVRSTAAEVNQLARLRIVGGGFYEYPARHAAARLQAHSRLRVEALQAPEFLHAYGPPSPQDEAVLLLSGSHSGFKKVVHRCAERARKHGDRVFSLTDSNDAALVSDSDVGLLLPEALEAPASTLSMFVLEWLAMEVLRTEQRKPGKGP